MFRIVFALFVGSCISMSSCTSEPKIKDTVKSIDVATGQMPSEVNKVVADTMDLITEAEPELNPAAAITAAPPTPVVEVRQVAQPKPQPKPQPQVKAQPQPKPQRIAPTYANITFDKMIHEFGEIDEGEKITHKFKFRNTGNAPLIIDNVDVSCGCTVPTYPFMPIGPGETGEIGVIYNSKGKFGTQKPSITIKTNASQPIVKLYMSGSIKHVFEKTTADTTDTKG